LEIPYVETEEGVVEKPDKRGRGNLVEGTAAPVPIVKTLEWNWNWD
jgi:hypothetical protein